MRAVVVLVALALGAGGVFLGDRLEAGAAAQNRQRAFDHAEKAAASAAAALQQLLALFQVKAQGAAATPALHALVRGAVDAATFHDSLNNEEWWAPYRDRGTSSAIYIGEQKAGGTASLLSDDELKLVALAAQASGDASRFASRQYVVAAARLPFTASDGRKVAVVLARPLSREDVEALGPGPLLVSDGKAGLLAHSDAATLPARVGEETNGPRDLGGEVAVPHAVGTLWVWASEPVGAEVAPLLPKKTVWGGSGVLSAAVLAFGVAAGRKKKRALVTQLLPLPLTDALPSPSRTTDDAVDRTSPSMAGRQSRYHEVAPLGEGGMARVSLAVTHGAEGFRRQFVLKRLKPEITVNPEVVAQFIDEARLGASLVHSNIVPIFDFGRDSEGYFMAQEYILGRDLEAVRRELFEQHRATLDLPLVLYVAHEALKALSYAHGKTDDGGKSLQLVHRDVSPNNLMVSERGEVKLLDFGIVKAAGKLSQTQEGMIKGNVFYMSPEQARGLSVDQRADLFSLGLVLFTCAAGEPLYRGTSNYDLLTRAAEGLSSAEWERVRKLPPALATLLSRALQPDPTKRFQAAEEFAGEIPAGAVGSATAMQQLMEALFKEDFARERARFSAMRAASS